MSDYPNLRRLAEIRMSEDHCQNCLLPFATAENWDTNHEHHEDDDDCWCLEICWSENSEACACEFDPVSTGVIDRAMIAALDLIEGEDEAGALLADLKRLAALEAEAAP